MSDLKEILTGMAIGVPGVKAVEQVAAEVSAANQPAGEEMSPNDLDIIAANTPQPSEPGRKGRKSKVAASDVLDRPAPHLYEIAFKNCPKLKVLADNVGLAWQLYKRHNGIRETVHKPTILDLGPARMEQLGDVPADAGTKVPPYCRL